MMKPRFDSPIFASRLTLFFFILLIPLWPDGHGEAAEHAGSGPSGYLGSPFPTDSPGEAGESRIYVDGTIYTAGDGSSWKTAKKTIASAIQDATSSNTEIWVAEGVYPEVITLKSNMSLYGGFDRHETSPEERDLQAHATTLNAAKAGPQNHPAIHAVIMDGIGNVRLDGLTISGGNAHAGKDATQPACCGGGIYCTRLSGVNKISNCLIQNNAALFGGGIFSSSGPLEIAHCLITANRAEHGGGIDCTGAVKIFDCTISKNTAVNVRYGDPVCGGGIDCRDNVTLSSCTISENGATQKFKGPDAAMTQAKGGGLCCEAGTLLATDCLIRNNLAGSTNYAAGGGVFCYPSVRLILSKSKILDNCISGVWGYGGGVLFSNGVISSCTLQGNDAPVSTGTAIHGYGGGVACTHASPEDGRQRLVGCTFNGNCAAYGGAVYAQNHSQTSVINCIMKHNTAIGGGVYGTDSTAIVNCTMVGNCAPDGFFGGAVASYFMGSHAEYHGGPAIVNTIFFNNKRRAISCATPTHPAIQACLFYLNADGDVGDDNGNVLSGTLALNHLPDCRNNLATDPLFVDEANEDYHLSNHSPAIDRGVEGAFVHQGPTVQFVSAPTMDFEVRHRNCA